MWMEGFSLLPLERTTKSSGKNIDFGLTASQIHEPFAMVILVHLVVGLVREYVAVVVVRRRVARDNSRRRLNRDVLVVRGIGAGGGGNLVGDLLPLLLLLLGPECVKVVRAGAAVVLRVAGGGRGRHGGAVETLVVADGGDGGAGRVLGGGHGWE